MKMESQIWIENLKTQIEEFTLTIWLRVNVFYNEDDKMLTLPFAFTFREISDAIKWKVSENGKGKKEEEISCGF